MSDTPPTDAQVAKWLASETIILDANEFEHLLNCMAQFQFDKHVGPAENTAIIRKAYDDARELLHNNPASRTTVPALCREVQRLRESISAALIVIGAGSTDDGFAVTDESKIGGVRSILNEALNP